MDAAALIVSGRASYIAVADVMLTMDVYSAILAGRPVAVQVFDLIEPIGKILVVASEAQERIPVVRRDGFEVVREESRIEEVRP
jgi:hypothetical protein